MHKNLEWNDWNWCQHFEILVMQNVEHSMKLWPLTCGCYMGWFHGRAEIWNSPSPSNHVLLCSFFCSCGFLCNVSNGFLALFIYLVSYFVVSTLFKKTNVTSGKKIDCPLKNNYLTLSVVYNANVRAESGRTGKNYIRLTEGTLNNVKRNTNFLFGTETIQTTSNHIWTLQVNAITPILQLTGVFWRQPRLRRENHSHRESMRPL